jgi:hypothetical protein
MKDNRMKDALENIARRGVPENTNLWPGIAARLERKSFMLTLRSRPLVAILLALLILLVLSGVVYALGRSLGYIPGIGLVDQSAPLRVLAEPVTLTRDGIVVTVEEAVLSSDKTIIKFSLDGISMLGNSYDITKCDDSSTGVSLSDGSHLKMIGGFGLNGWQSGYEARYIFDAMPSSVNDASFIPPCIQDFVPGAKLEDWKSSLHFVPAPPEMTVMPVIEVTPSPQASNENPLTLEKVIKTDDGYILAGTFSSVGFPPNEKAVQFGQPPTITDAGGQKVPFDFANYKLDLPAEKMQTEVSPWAFELHGKQFDWPLTIMFNSLAVELSDAQAQFEFDAGPTSKDGQVWENLNIHFELAGHPVHVLNVIRMPDSYQFNFATEDSTFFNAVDISIGDSTQGITGIDGPSKFVSEAKFADTVPSGKMTVLLSHPVILESGNWQLQWKPDHAPTLPTPTTVSQSAPQACLTIDSWKAALANPAPIPADLSGKIILSEYNNLPANSSSPLVYIANLDGSNLKKIGSGVYDISPSPDGSQVVYSLEDGLYIENVATGESHQIPNTISNDRIPYWSPDGTRIAFLRFESPTSQPNIYTINPDGTDTQRITQQTGDYYLLGWSPDSSALLFAMFAQREGYQLKKVEFASGMISDLLALRAGHFDAVAPDGNDVVFHNLIDETSQGLYISHLDGSDRRLIGLTTSDNNWNLSSAVWSPDGKWLAVSITSANPNMPAAALVNSQTCQIIPLPITGTITSWLH